jgi:hypothetical protein
MFHRDHLLVNCVVSVRQRSGAGTLKGDPRMHSRPTATRLALAWATAPTLAAALALGACGSSQPSDGPSSTAAAAGTAATTAAAKTITVTVSGSTVTPAPATYPLGVGQTMAVVVTSDHADEVHAHGFEVEKEVKPGVPVTLELTGTVPGVYEVEMHDPALTLLQIAVS